MGRLQGNPTTYNRKEPHGAKRRMRNKGKQASLSANCWRQRYLQRDRSGHRLPSIGTSGYLHRTGRPWESPWQQQVWQDSKSCLCGLEKVSARHQTSPCQQGLATALPPPCSLALWGAADILHFPDDQPDKVWLPMDLSGYFFSYWIQHGLV